MTHVRTLGGQVRQATAASGWDGPHNTLLLNVVSLAHTAAVHRPDLALLLHAAGVHDALVSLAQLPRAHDAVVAAAARLALHLYTPAQGLVWAAAKEEVEAARTGQLEAMLVHLLHSPNWDLKQVC